MPVFRETKRELETTNDTRDERAYDQRRDVSEAGY